jgi:hypothetical protein
MLDSVRHLNFQSLEKAAHAEVEPGEVKTECCHHLVRAVIRKGSVTGLKIEPISKEARTPITPALRPLVDAVKRKLKVHSSKAPKFPILVAKFFVGDVADISVTTITCIQICFFGWCTACCFNGDIAICGKLTIDTTKDPYPEEL